MAIDWLNMDTKIWSYTGNQNKAWRMVRVRAGAYLGSKRIMCYYEMRLMHKNEHKIYHIHHQTKYEITYGTHDISLKFIFILSKTSLMLGPHQNPIYLSWIGLTNSIVLELWEKKHSCLCKIKRNRRLFENQSGIKIVREKTWFLKFIWKLESWRLLENWSLGS